MGSEELHLFVPIECQRQSPPRGCIKLFKKLGWTALSSDLIHKLPGHAFAHTLPVAYLGHLESQIRSEKLSSFAARSRFKQCDPNLPKLGMKFSEPGIVERRRRFYGASATEEAVLHFFETMLALQNGSGAIVSCLSKKVIPTQTKLMIKKGYSNYFSAGLSFPKQASVFNVAALVLRCDSYPDKWQRCYSQVCCRLDSHYLPT